jgi:hypothetical protein
MDLTSDQKMFIILDELKKTLYIDPVTHGDPTPDSDIETWFERVDAADTATNAPIKPHRAPFHPCGGSAGGKCRAGFNGFFDDKNKNN